MVADAKLTKDVGDLLNTLTRASTYATPGAVAHIATNATHPDPPAPAWYEPKTGDAYIHFDRAGVTLEQFGKSRGKEHAVVVGLLQHELAHSAWSGWLLTPQTINEMTPAQHAIATTLEELRIELRAVNKTAGNFRSNFRASLGLVVKGATEVDPKEMTRYDVANMWALVYGRALITVVDPSEVSWVDTACRVVLGDDDVDRLVDILEEVLEWRTGLKTMIQLTQEWLDIVGEPESPSSHCGHSSHEGKPGEGESSPSKGMSTTTESGAEDGERDPELDDKTSAAGVMDSVEKLGAAKDTYSERIGEDEAELVANMVKRALLTVSREWDNMPLDLADPNTEAAKYFGSRKTRARLSETPPTAHHHLHVTRTAKVLQNIVVPSISKVTVASEVPPGRLRTREAIRGSAERSRGLMSTARPWEGTKRRHTKVRPIVVGIATDTSGSMRWAEAAVADFAYTWANAGQRVAARTAAVTFCDDVTNVLAPGEPMPMVRRKNANGGSENADKALAALDGVLKLSTQNGAAKLLVVVSDGHLVIQREGERVVKRFRAFKAGGTKVLWITPKAAGNRLFQILTREGLADVVELNITPTYVHSDVPPAGVFDMIQDAALARLSKMVY